jgi:hypothetical protein
MKKLIMLLIVAVCLAASPAFALNGYKLSHYCKVAIDSEGKRMSMQTKAEINICYATIEAVFLSIAEFPNAVKVEQPNKFSCMPEQLQLKEQVRIIYLYMRKHKERLDLPAVQLIMEAFAEAFPC